MENIHPLRLRLLLEVDRTGSVSAAAKACAVGQPSASMHLRTLETAIGHKLIARGSSGSSLTPAGRVVASHAARVLATLDNMVRSLDNREGGELMLAASLTPSLTLLPALLRQFSDRYPGVSVKLRTLPSVSVVEAVARGEADFGIAGDAGITEAVVRTPLVLDELIGIAPAGSVSADDGWMNLGEFARNRLLVGAEGSSTRLATEQGLARAEYRPTRVWVLDSYIAIKRAVAEGLGVSFISRRLVEGEMQRGELSVFRVRGMEPMARSIHLIQSAVKDSTPQGGKFLTLLRDSLEPPGGQRENATDLP